MTHPIHEASDYAATRGIPTLHEHPAAVDDSEPIEARRLRHELIGVRSHLEQLAGPHPDGTCRADPNSRESQWAAYYGLSPRDSGVVMRRLDFLARTSGLGHPEIVTVLGMIAAWEGRLPQEFEVVRAEYLAWHATRGETRMYGDWLVGQE